MIRLKTLLEQQVGKFDEKLLIGKWVTNKTNFYRYDANYSGVTWDTNDDVTEAEAQKFDWKLEKDGKLTQTHKMEIGGTVPKTYMINTLNPLNLTYTDPLTKAIIKFTKVP